MIKKTLTALALCISTLAFAQPAPGDSIVANSTFDMYTTTLSGFTGSVLYREPTDWKCTNYPRLNKTCFYFPTTATESGSVGISSVPVGTTTTARMSYPVNPQWWQVVFAPYAGTYQLETVVRKSRINYNSAENYYQAVVIKNGLTVLVNKPHAELPLDTDVTITTPVYLNAGSNAIYLGLAVRTIYGSVGNMYQFKSFNLKTTQ